LAATFETNGLGFEDDVTIMSELSCKTCYMASVLTLTYICYKKTPSAILSSCSSVCLLSTALHIYCIWHMEDHSLHLQQAGYISLLSCLRNCHGITIWLTRTCWMACP